MTNAAVRSVPRSREPSIARESTADVVAREALLDEAFGPSRFAKTCERLRVGRMPARALSLVARAGGRLVGTVRLWPVNAGGAPALMLGPLAVARSHRDCGLGGALMREAIARAKAEGHRAIILVGDAPYYARFGFSRDVVAGLVLPGPVEIERFLGLELEPGALAGARGLVVATGEKAVRRRERAIAQRMVA